MSKIKKITAIRKKWMEKGKRLYVIGLNPHSNGVDFCKSMIGFFEIIIIKIMIIILIKVTIIKWITTKLIIYFRLKLLSWKLNILIILSK